MIQTDRQTHRKRVGEGERYREPGESHTLA